MFAHQASTSQRSSGTACCRSTQELAAARMFSSPAGKVAVEDQDLHVSMVLPNVVAVMRSLHRLNVLRVRMP